MGGRNAFFPPIKMAQASEIVEKSIRDFILNTKLKPGDKLPSQSELSELFNVSVLTIREALSGLKAMGLIQKKKGKGGGIFVGNFQEDSLKTALQNFFTWKNVTARHLIEARMIIEPPAARVAMEVITPLELEELKENIWRCEEKIIRMEKDKGYLFKEKYFEIEKVNVDFHRILLNRRVNI